MSWRDHIKVHPAAELFPIMSEPELRELAEDIKANGQRTPALFLVMQDGDKVLLDGRNRLHAMELAGLLPDGEFPTYYDTIVDEPGLDPHTFVLSLNLHRRHLTNEQKIALVEKLARERPDWSARRVAKVTKVSPTTATKVINNREAKGDVSTVDTRTDVRGRQQPAHKSRVGRTIENGTPTAQTIEQEGSRISEPASRPDNPIIVAWDCASREQQEDFLQHLATRGAVPIATSPVQAPETTPAADASSWSRIRRAIPAAIHKAVGGPSRHPCREN